MNHLKKYSILCFLPWIVFLIINTTSNSSTIKGLTALLIETGLDIIALIFCFQIYLFFKKIRQKNSLAFLLFGISFIFIAYGDFCYNLNVGIQHTVFVSSITYSVNFPLCMFLFFQLCAWTYLLFSHDIKVKKHLIILDIPILIIILSSIIIFLFIFPWNKNIPMIHNIYQWIDINIELMTFIVAMLCLMLSKNKGLALCASGYLIIIASDFLLRYAFLNQTLILNSYNLQLIWSLGQTLFLMGLIKINQGKNDQKEFLNNFYALETQCALWVYTLSFLGLAFFILVNIIFLPDSYYEYKQYINNFPAALVLFSVFSISVSSIFAKKLLRPFGIINAYIESANQIDFTQLPSCQISKNIDSKIEEFNDLLFFISKAFEAFYQRYVAEKALIDNASQVAHDIRSPLAALNTCLKQLPQLPESYRTLMQNAADRINGIANNLLINRNGSSGINIEQIYLLSTLIENIISEKRLQFYASSTKIELCITPSGLTAFVKINPKEMQRLFSNLLNNAFEAINHKTGRVLITLDSDIEKITLTIADNGCGIEHEKSV